jgi:hypothetical protein
MRTPPTGFSKIGELAAKTVPKPCRVISKIGQLAAKTVPKTAEQNEKNSAAGYRSPCSPKKLPRYLLLLVLPSALTLQQLGHDHGFAMRFFRGFGTHGRMGNDVHSGTGY